MGTIAVLLGRTLASVRIVESLLVLRVLDRENLAVTAAFRSDIPEDVDGLDCLRGMENGPSRADMPLNSLRSRGPPALEGRLRRSRNIWSGPDCVG